MSSLLFAAVDVDDTAFHAAVFDPSSDRIIAEFKTKSCAKALAERIKKVADTRPVRVCYESTYLGFALKRQLERLGLTTDVIASSLIPTLKGKRQKTDRLDCRRQAPLFAKGLLTVVTAPEPEDESVRDLLRSRAFSVRQVTRTKNHIVKLLRRAEISFASENPKAKSLWTKTFRDWLSAKAQSLAAPALAVNLRVLLRQLSSLEETVATYDSEIEAQAKSDRYAPRVKALTAFRGLAVTNAMTIVTELGDPWRFPHPKNLVGYVGLSVVEYSSGGNERRYGIAKTGNAHVRTALVEACQFALTRPRVSSLLRRRRTDTPADLVAVADRCMERLHRKGTRLLFGGKPRNKVKVALAREMVGFIWESLRMAQPK